MDAGTKQLADILNGNRVLEVPYYQRSYVWKEDQWSRFLSDMEYITSTGRDYFLGSIILKQQPTGISPFDVQSIIDGQQRFTTFALFFKSLCLKTDDPETFESKFMVRDRKTKTRHIAIRHSINDRKDFEAIVALKKDVPYEPEITSNITRAYNYFRENINPDKIDVDILLNHVIFIGISLQQGEDEQVIFDTINSLGVRLTTGELLKNYFFTESTREEYEEFWAPIFEKDREMANYWDSEIVSGRLKRANIDFFFTAYLNIKIQDPAIKVSADHKVRYRRSEGLFNNYKDLISTYNLDKTTMIYNILEYALLYHDNINPDIAQGEIPGTPGIERINFLIFVLEYTTIVPYVLYLLKNVADVAERNAMFGYIESYILRRQICKSDNKNFSDLFSENLILNQVTTLEALKDYIENKDDFQALALPRDRKVIKACHDKSYPNKKALAILYLLETAIREGKPHATKLYPFERYSLEHLMPKSWKENWPLPECVTEEDRDDAVSCLGNLAMLPQKLNTSISNASWATKKAGNGRNQGIVFYASDIETLANVVTKHSWDETTISERADWIAAKAIEIWPSYLPEEDEEDSSEASDIGNSGSNSAGAFTHDRTKFSLNGAPATSKRQFVLDVVKAYVQKHPDKTFAELKKIFHTDLCSPGFKCIGMICSEAEHTSWDNKYKNKRYSIGQPDGRLCSADGIYFYVNTQWAIDGMDGIIKLAKSEGFKVTRQERSTPRGEADIKEVQDNIATSIAGGSIDIPVKIKP